MDGVQVEQEGRREVFDQVIAQRVFEVPFDRGMALHDRGAGGDRPSLQQIQLVADEEPSMSWPVP